MRFEQQMNLINSMTFKLKSKPSPGCTDKFFCVIFIEVEEFFVRNSFDESATKDEEVSPHLCWKFSICVGGVWMDWGLVK